jgi:hypothetical protein
MKRETLMILAEGVTDPKQIDELFVQRPSLSHETKAEH